MTSVAASMFAPPAATPVTGAAQTQPETDAFGALLGLSPPAPTIAPPATVAELKLAATPITNLLTIASLAKDEPQPDILVVQPATPPIVEAPAIPTECPAAPEAPAPEPPAPTVTKAKDEPLPPTPPVRGRPETPPIISTLPPVAQPATFAPVAELAKKELAKAEKPESDVLADEAPLAIVINLPSPVIVPVAIAVPIEPAPAETKAASPTTASVDSGASHPVSPAPGLAIATEGGKGDASSDQGDSAKEAAFQAPAPTAEDAEPGAAPAPAPAREAAPVLATALAQPTAPAEHAAKIPIATITAQPGRIGQELGVAIAHHVASGSAATGGGETITLRLNPVDMGRIEVKLSFDDSGTLRAIVSADTPAALDMLRRDSADLGRALSDAGVRADTQTLRFDTRAGDGQRGQANDNGPAWQRPQDGRSGPTTDAGPDVAEDITAYRPLRTRGGVDMVA